MRLIDADELKKHKYHSDITHENAVSVAQIDWMPTVCDIEQIRDEIAELDMRFDTKVKILEIIDKYTEGAEK